MNNIEEDDFEVVPERVTKLKTSSEIARSRALDKAGLTLDWYNEHVEASRNSNGEPCCESCSSPETKKLPNGKIKELVVDTKNKKLVCQKCADKSYRQTQKDNVSKRQDRDGVSTLQDFWVRNRNKLDEAEKVQREARHDEVIGLMNEVALCNLAFEQKVQFDEAAMRDLIRIVCRDIVEYGTVLTDITAVPFFKPEYAEFYEFWTSGKTAYKAQTPYMQYGYLDGLPGHVVYPFLEHVERHLGLPISLYDTYEARIGRIYDFLDHGIVYQRPGRYTRCATPGCDETKVYHFSDPANWYCATHAEVNRKAAMEVRDRIRRAQLAELSLVNEPQKWARPFLTRAEKAERDIPYGEEGPYGPSDQSR